MNDDRYARLYHRFPREFPEVWADDHALATWVRLLLTADASWPLHPPVPRSAKSGPMRCLETAGLLVTEADTYTVLGLDKERTERSAKAAVAGRARQQALSKRSANAEQALSLTEQSRAEQSRTRSEPLPGDDGRDDLEAWLLVRRGVPTERQRAFLDGYVRTFDLTGPARAARLILANPDDPIAAMKADLDAFRAERIAAAKASEAPHPARRKGSGLTGINAELARMFHAQDAEREGVA